MFCCVHICSHALTCAHMRSHHLTSWDPFRGNQRVEISPGSYHVLSRARLAGKGLTSCQKPVCVCFCQVRPCPSGPFFNFPSFCEEMRGILPWDILGHHGTPSMEISGSRSPRGLIERCREPDWLEMIGNHIFSIPNAFFGPWLGARSAPGGSYSDV